ncbi:hypothetical protein [Kamptonema formosum]|uniref:hypothetical protein n=1 Tax=Kamptonema formosum TaxID=331992 RepID=UPI0003472465|nr:hypothetical protein [Oscillatoria sp. PCC 10802]
MANLIPRHKSQFISIPDRDSRKGALRELHTRALSKIQAVFGSRDNRNNRHRPVAGGNRQPPDPEDISARDSTAQSQPIQNLGTETPDSEKAGMIWLEKIVLWVALILLGIAAVNTAIAIYPQENPQRQQEVQQ